MKLKFWVIFRILILFSWAAILSILVAKHSTISTKVLLALPSYEPRDSEEWMGIYFDNKKVGYVHTVYSKMDFNQRVLERSFLKLKLMNQPREVRTIVDALFDSSSRLKKFSFNIVSEEITLGVNGIAEKDGISLVIDTGGTRRKEFIKTSAPIYITQGLKFFLQQQKIKPGDRFFVQLLDPSILKDSAMKIEVLKEEEILHEGKRVKALKLKQSFMGLETTSWVTTHGEVLREEGPMGTLAVKETAEDALNKGWSDDEEMDFILATAIPVKEEIQNPRAVSYLKLKITGLEELPQSINDYRQRFAAGVLEVKREDLEKTGKGIKLPIRNEKMKIYLSATPLIQSDAEGIIALAKKITKGTDDAVLAVDMIKGWLYRNLDKTPTISIPSALEVLKSMQGDCNEHTILFTAIARAIGIPARTVAGIVYQKGYFFYHAWPEVYLGDWVSVDPTFNQFPADATHIKLAEGDVSDWLELVKVVGRLHIDILNKIEEY